jgi:cyclophilin family peptidyl-prolyl cis-trans isomerase
MNSKKIVLSLLVFILAGFSTFAQLSKNKKKDYVVTISTSFGDINLVLFDETPLHKENFIKLVKQKKYDSTTFHRVIKGFMIQGGDPNSKDNDPNNDGMGGPGYTVTAEFNPKFTHVQGALAAARMGDQVNPTKASSGSQFYIVENKEGTHFLNNNYTVFGMVINGLDVVSKIAEQAKDSRDRPLTDIRIIAKIELLKKKKILKKYNFDVTKFNPIK